MSRSVLITGATRDRSCVSVAGGSKRLAGSGFGRVGMPATLQSETGCEVVAANLSDSSAAAFV